MLHRDFTKRPPTHPVKTPKLIRDKMPGFHARDKCEAEYRIVTSDEEFARLLGDKLREEVEEFLANPSVEEAADIGAVLKKLFEVHSISIDDVEKAGADKVDKLGAFDSRLLMTRFEWGPELPTPLNPAEVRIPDECVCRQPITAGNVRWNGDHWEHKDEFAQGGHHRMTKD
jgi:predicted house-cleaning noncanonical NTP pyrophosphatase (MazG superfamily)